MSFVRWCLLSIQSPAFKEVFLQLLLKMLKMKISFSSDLLGRTCPLTNPVLFSFRNNCDSTRNWCIFMEYIRKGLLDFCWIETCHRQAWFSLFIVWGLPALEKRKWFLSMRGPNCHTKYCVNTISEVQELQEVTEKHLPIWSYYQHRWLLLCSSCLRYPIVLIVWGKEQLSISVFSGLVSSKLSRF